MKLGMLLDSCSRNAGGLFESVRRLSQSLHENINRVSIFAVRDELTGEDLDAWAPMRVQVETRVFPRAWGYAPGLADSLDEANLDVLMIHGLWQYCSLAALNWHLRTRRPHIIHPHGMLDPWALGNSYWKKQIARLLYENKHLSTAACLRALCESEAQAIRALGLKNPVCVIPNGIDLPEESEVLQPPPWRAVARGRKVLLYLGRIHPKKNLPPLLDAWAAIRNERDSGEWLLVVAGWDQNGHEAELKKQAQKLDLSSRVHFAGPLFGSDKIASYQHSNAFVLPSLSEGLPMVVLEAWAHALPVLMTDACNLPEGFAAGAAMRLTTDAEGMRTRLIELISTAEDSLTSMGENGQRLVTERFSWKSVAEEMSRVVRWVKHGGHSPASLHP